MKSEGGRQVEGIIVAMAMVDANGNPTSETQFVCHGCGHVS